MDAATARKLGFIVIEDRPDCAYCKGTGWCGDPYLGAAERCAGCHGSGSDLPALRDYNDLEPPANPNFPWKGRGWQMLCYYCCQPIQVKQPEAGYRQRGWPTWEHVNPAACPEVPHIDGSHWHCEPAKILANIERHKAMGKQFERPRCHVCGTQTNKHKGVCSFGGWPAFHATTMSSKEEELTRVFGWHPNAPKPAVKETEIKTSTVVGVAALLALVAFVGWARGSE